MVRRVGLIATLATGVALLGASLHGMANVDRTLEIAAAPKPSPELLQERTSSVKDCERFKQHRGGGREV
jgi:hypothetical protein